MLPTSAAADIVALFIFTMPVTVAIEPKYSISLSITFLKIRNEYAAAVLYALLIKETTYSSSSEKINGNNLMLGFVSALVKKLLTVMPIELVKISRFFERGLFL